MHTRKLEIIVSGALPRPEVELSPAAFTAREAACTAASRVQAITSVADLDEAARALTLVKALAKTVEDSRKEIKVPILDIGRRIDATAKDYLAPLEAESRRLSVLVGSYQEAEKRKAERILQEEAAKQAAALAEMQAAQSAAMAAGDEAAADAARAEAADKIAASQIAAINAVGAQADGITTRTTWKFEVLDIAALYAARPELCIVEPNNAAIRAVIKASRGAALPGLRIWQEAAAIVRGAAPVDPEKYDY